jgi:hypothetical protein
MPERFTGFLGSLSSNETRTFKNAREGILAFKERVSSEEELTAEEEIAFLNHLSNYFDHGRRFRKNKIDKGIFEGWDFSKLQPSKFSMILEWENKHYPLFSKGWILSYSILQRYMSDFNNPRYLREAEITDIVLNSDVTHTPYAAPEKNSITIDDELSEAIVRTPFKKPEDGWCSYADIAFQDSLQKIKQLRREPTEDGTDLTYEGYKTNDPGVLITYDNNIIGVIKFIGAQTFLAARTIRSQKGEVLFLRGGIYSLDGITGDQLKEMRDNNTAGKQIELRELFPDRGVSVGDDSERGLAFIRFINLNVDKALGKLLKSRDEES